MWRGGDLWLGGSSAAGDMIREGGGLGGGGGGRKKKGKERLDKIDESAVMVSRTWPTQHDGSGIEIIDTQWIPSRSARSLHRPNRRARLAEYAGRRIELLNVFDGVNKRLKRRRTMWTMNRVELQTIGEEESEVMVAGGLVWDGKGDVGFRFDPQILHDVLFSPEECNSDEEEDIRSNPRKRRRIEGGNVGRDKEKKEKRDVVLENDERSFVLERIADEGGRRWKITTVKEGATPNAKVHEKPTDTSCIVTTPSTTTVTENDSQRALVKAQPTLVPQAGELPLTLEVPPNKQIPASITPSSAPPPSKVTIPAPAPVQPPVSGSESPTSVQPNNLPAIPSVPLPLPSSVVMGDLEEGDMAFLPNGIHITRCKITQDNTVDKDHPESDNVLLACSDSLVSPMDVDSPQGNCDFSHLGLFIEVLRWKWRPRN